MIAFFREAIYFIEPALLSSTKRVSLLLKHDRQGGDTDTNGCIGGALLGAYYGADAIPKNWKDTVVKARPKRLKTYPKVYMGDLEEFAAKLFNCCPLPVTK